MWRSNGVNQLFFIIFEEMTVFAIELLLLFPLFFLKTQGVNVVQDLYSAIREGRPVLHTVLSVFWIKKRQTLHLKRKKKSFVFLYYSSPESSHSLKSSRSSYLIASPCFVCPFIETPADECKIFTILSTVQPYTVNISTQYLPELPRERERKKKIT